MVRRAGAFKRGEFLVGSHRTSPILLGSKLGWLAGGRLSITSRIGLWKWAPGSRIKNQCARNSWHASVLDVLGCTSLRIS
eukprot:2002224-Amphidinium_carterae.1